MRYDFGYPFIFGTGITLLISVSPFPIQIFGNSGLLNLIIGILQILAGFYIASLAAVSTFAKEGMDDLMAGKTPELLVLKNNKEISEKLTRRRFLSLMFGYLAFISIFLYFIGGAANLISSGIASSIPVKIQPYIKWSFIWAYMVFTSNMVVTTLLGLFYMCDRIHRK